MLYGPKPSIGFRLLHAGQQCAALRAFPDRGPDGLTAIGVRSPDGPVSCRIARQTSAIHQETVSQGLCVYDALILLAKSPAVRLSISSFTGCARNEISCLRYPVFSQESARRRDGKKRLTCRPKARCHHQPARVRPMALSTRWKATSSKCCPPSRNPPNPHMIWHRAAVAKSRSCGPEWRGLPKTGAARQPMSYRSHRQRKS